MSSGARLGGSDRIWLSFRDITTGRTTDGWTDDGRTNLYSFFDVIIDVIFVFLSFGNRFNKC